VLASTFTTKFSTLRTVAAAAAVTSSDTVKTNVSLSVVVLSVMTSVTLKVVLAAVELISPVNVSSALVPFKTSEASVVRRLVGDFAKQLINKQTCYY
jgi:hypothetical protein